MSSRIQDTTYFAVFLQTIQGSNSAICFCQFYTERRLHRTSLAKSRQMVSRSRHVNLNLPKFRTLSETDFCETRISETNKALDFKEKIKYKIWIQNISSYENMMNSSAHLQSTIHQVLKKIENTKFAFQSTVLSYFFLGTVHLEAFKTFN